MLFGYNKQSKMVIFHFSESGNNTLLRRFVNHVERELLGLRLSATGTPNLILI